ncbi:competence type IV pilus major pilin ComGC [[Eubacterium] hominis]|uniref:competence type IV pilus major pilin ComGC n=1 Tax=[Eubacterium] hominis TaxID=2764325 RepID=UPI003A4E3C2F
MKKNIKGFTILEMMIVLSIIAIVFLLTLPNIQQKQDIIRDQGCNALLKVVDAQVLLYEVDNLSPPTSMSQLISKGYLKESQRRCPNGDQIEIVNGEASIR